MIPGPGVVRVSPGMVRGVTCAVAVLLVAAVGAGADGARATERRGIAPVQREFVAVAYLDPDLVLDVNIVTGRFRVSSEALGFGPGLPRQWESQLPNRPDETGVIGIWDPLKHRLFRYEGGNPGYVAARPESVGDAPLPANGRLPVWSSPRLVRDGRLSRELVFADGRWVTIAVDARGRTTMVSWPAFAGARLITRVAYSGASTSISDPFGVTRTYVHKASGEAFELVPAAWRTGPGYRHWVSPLLDDARETGFVQARTVGRSGDLTDGFGRVAGRSFGGVSFDSPANAGYLQVGLTSAAAAARVDATLRRRGLLDVSAILPVHSTQRELASETDSLERPLGAAGADCHASWGDGVDTIVISVANTITPAEVKAMDDAVRRLHSWTVIEVQGSNECATPEISLTGGRESLDHHNRCPTGGERWRSPPMSRCYLPSLPCTLIVVTPRRCAEPLAKP
jgi:hypothetical protein